MMVHVITKGLIDKIVALKNKSNSIGYNQAIDDVLSLLPKATKQYQVRHRQSGLLFNGYNDSDYPRGKNTLSPTNGKTISSSSENENEILENFFAGRIVLINGIESIRNEIVYEGSDIHKILALHYTNYDYLPITDFELVELHKK